MRILSLEPELVETLESMGFRRSVVSKSKIPGLPQDVLTLDFSGWPIYTHSAVSDAAVTAFCAALERRKDHIPWQGEGPLPVERLCTNAPDAPLDIPLHPAAERFWHERGYI